MHQKCLIVSVDALSAELFFTIQVFAYYGKTGYIKASSNVTIEA